MIETKVQQPKELQLVVKKPDLIPESLQSLPPKLSGEEVQLVKKFSEPQLDKVLNSFVNEAFDLELLKKELPQILTDIKHSGEIITVGDIGVIQKKLVQKEGELKQIGELLLTSPKHANKLKGFMQFGTWWTKNESKYPREEGERSDKYRRRLKSIYDAEKSAAIKLIE